MHLTASALTLYSIDGSTSNPYVDISSANGIRVVTSVGTLTANALGFAITGGASLKVDNLGALMGGSLRIGSSSGGFATVIDNGGRYNALSNFASSSSGYTAAPGSPLLFMLVTINGSTFAIPAYAP